MNPQKLQVKTFFLNGCLQGQKETSVPLPKMVEDGYFSCATLVAPVDVLPPPRVLQCQSVCSVF